MSSLSKVGVLGRDMARGDGFLGCVVQGMGTGLLVFGINIGGGIKGSMLLVG